MEKSAIIKSDYDFTNEFFKLTVDFVFEAIVYQFLNDNGNYDSPIISIINWDKIFDKGNIGKNISLLNQNI
jgi:hypothetical protein